jgi:hypothetical protein
MVMSTGKLFQTVRSICEPLMYRSDTYYFRELRPIFRQQQNSEVTQLTEIQTLLICRSKMRLAAFFGGYLGVQTNSTAAFHCLALHRSGKKNSVYDVNQSVVQSSVTAAHRQLHACNLVPATAAVKSRDGHAAVAACHRFHFSQ